MITIAAGGAVHDSFAHKSSEGLPTNPPRTYADILTYSARSLGTLSKLQLSPDCAAMFADKLTNTSGAVVSTPDGV